jgi:hypothetical protein
VRSCDAARIEGSVRKNEVSVSLTDSIQHRSPYQ